MLTAKKKAVESDLEYKRYQHKSGMPCEPGLDDDSIALLALHELGTQRDRLGAEIAEKRLQLFDLEGA